MQTLEPKLDVSKLESVKEIGDCLQSACPACRAVGRDRKGDNLKIYPDFHFACAANLGDREHAAEILRMVGIKNSGWRPEPCHKRPQPTRRTVNPADEEKRLWWAANEPLTHKMRSALYDCREACEQFADELGLKWETLHDLTSPAFDAVALVPAGFIPKEKPLRNRRLGLIYDGALKIRSPWPNVRFLMRGRPSRPWRSIWLTRPELRIERVHIVESESDALTLIEAGYERPFDGECVIAVSGANGWRPEWADLVSGRQIHLWPDRDTKGSEFVDTVGRDTFQKNCTVKIHKL